MTRFGEISPAVRSLIAMLTEKTDTAANDLVTQEWPLTAGDIEPIVIEAINAAQRANRATRDLRAALSAYAHKLHHPRPKVTSIAAAQGTVIQGLVHRYTKTTLQALQSLIDGHPDIDALRAAFPSLNEDELATLTLSHPA